MFFLSLADKDAPVLRQKAKKITVFDHNLEQLVKEMAEIMYKADGVGLAAPQVGISKCLVVIDVGEGLLPLVNPEIIYTEGEETASEGCLSLPGVFAKVSRAERVVVKAQNIRGEEVRIPGSGLLARAMQHEVDHLSGVLFIDKAEPDKDGKK
ncbi:MAG: peptide deformylase [bacterium]